ncbi:MAG: hypothetical protein GY756_06065 [bacterium]|nr:hypothetical protein [bacterium]
MESGILIKIQKQVKIVAVFADKRRQETAYINLTEMSAYEILRELAGR